MDSALYFWKESNVKRACEAKLTPISVDFDAKTGVFPASKGSSTYTCSLDSCSCTDFAINHKPCKHMIRLAYELNIIDLPGVASSASAAQEKIDLAAVDDFVKNASLPVVIRTFKSLSNLKDGVVVSDEDIRFAADCLPFFVTEKNVFRLELWSVFKSFTAKVNNRLGLLLTKHIGEISSQTLDEIFFWMTPPILSLNLLQKRRIARIFPLKICFQPSHKKESLSKTFATSAAVSGLRAQPAWILC